MQLKKTRVNSSQQAAIRNVLIQAFNALPDDDATKQRLEYWLRILHGHGVAEFLLYLRRDGMRQ